MGSLVPAQLRNLAPICHILDMPHLSQAQSTNALASRPNSVSKSLYKPLDFVLVRAPLLPIESYLALSGEADGVDAGREAATAVSHHVGGLAPHDPRVRRALIVGSASLLNALERSTPSSRDALDLQRKLLRYLIRMSTRPTPYGMFAGVALGHWGSRTDLALAEEPPRLRTRLDMAWLFQQILALESQLEVRQHLRLITNPVSFIYADRVYLSERAPTASTDSASTVSVRATNVVKRTLALARQPIPYQDLTARLLESTPGATPDKIEKLLTDLWQQTILTTDLRPPLTTDNPARYVTRRLAGIPAAQQVLHLLEILLDKAAQWDALPPEAGEAAYRELLAQAQSLSKPAPAPDSSSRPESDTPFQVDMAWPLGGRQLNRTVGAEVARAAELLLRMTPFPQGLPHMRAYRSAFESRYGSDREIPLLELLDPSFGLGPPHLHGGANSWHVAPSREAERARTLLDLACNALRDGRLAVELDEETLARLETWKPTPATAPPTLDIMAFVAASSAADLDAGQFQIIIGPNLGAQSAGRNLGRFADLLAPETLRAASGLS
jgi:hypothetical protein